MANAHDDLDMVPCPHHGIPTHVICRQGIVGVKLDDI